MITTDTGSKFHTVLMPEEKMRNVIFARHLRTSLTILVAGILAAYFIFTQIMNPAPFYVHYDPEMPYFFNSLSINRTGYVYIDHPGTPVEIIGTAFLLLTYPFIHARNIPFKLFYIQHPEIFLWIAYIFLTFSSIAGTIILIYKSLSIKKWVDALVAVTVGVLFYAIHPMAFGTLVLWSHNSFNFPFGTLLLFYTYLCIRSGKPIRWRQKLITGLVSGILITIMINMVTWLFGICLVIFLYNIQCRLELKKIILDELEILLFSILGFVIGTIPIMSRYSQFINWIYSLLIHSGRYGSGDVGLPSIQQYTNHLIQLFHSTPYLFLIPLFLVLVLCFAWFFRRKLANTNPGLWPACLGITVQLIIVILVVGKHPGPIYLLLAASIVPVLFLASYELTKSAPRVFQYGWSACCTFILVLFVWNGIHAAQSHQGMVQKINTSQKLIDQTLYQTATARGISPQKQTILWTYGTLSRCQSLWFGNEYVKNAFSSEILKVCANEGYLNIWNQRAYNGQKQLPLDQFSWDVILAPERIISSYPFLKNAGEVTPVNGQRLTFEYGPVMVITPKENAKP